MVLSANFFVYAGILVTFCVSSVRLHTIPLTVDDEDHADIRINKNDTDTSSFTHSKDSLATSNLNKTPFSKIHAESSPVLNNSTNNVYESPPKSTTPSTIHRKTTISSTKQTVVENPHELSVASVEKFVKGYFARKNRNASLLLAEVTKAPSVEHILDVISLSSDQSPAAAAEHTSKKPKDDLIAIITPGPAAAPLAAEKTRIQLSAGNIVGVVSGVLVLMTGFIYFAMSYFPKARRRSSYTEMFINDTENEEEIALADYSEARGDN